MRGIYPVAPSFLDVLRLEELLHGSLGLAKIPGRDFPFKEFIQLSGRSARKRQ